MSVVADPAELPVTAHPEANGGTRMELAVEGNAISRLWVIPFTLRVGQATVRMDGIGGVGTDEAYRNRGYSRRVLDATVQRMQEGDAALSMLYGIPDYYPKFGYATAGPDHYLQLTDLSADAPLPSRWQARPVRPGDLPALRRLYDRNTAGAVGAAVRAPDARPWQDMAALAAGERDDACRVVEDPRGSVAAYAWRGQGYWYVTNLDRDRPEALILGEVMAEGPAAADAVLALCRRWGAEDAVRRGVKRVVLSLPSDGPVAAAVMRQRAELTRLYAPCGGSMARVLDVRRLLAALLPELADRLRRSSFSFAGCLRFVTDLGAAALRLGPNGAAIVPGERYEEAEELQLPQTDLARLALGAFPPEDILDRLERPLPDEVRHLVTVLFPERHPHMYLPDRF